MYFKCPFTNKEFESKLKFLYPHYVSKTKLSICINGINAQAGQFSLKY